MESTITLGNRTFALIVQPSGDGQTFWYEVYDEDGEVVADSSEYEMYFVSELEALRHVAADAIGTLYNLAKDANV